MLLSVTTVITAPRVDLKTSLSLAHEPATPNARNKVPIISSFGCWSSPVWQFYLCSYIKGTGRGNLVTLNLESQVLKVCQWMSQMLTWINTSGELPKKWKSVTLKNLLGSTRSRKARSMRSSTTAPKMQLSRKSSCSSAGINLTGRLVRVKL